MNMFNTKIIHILGFGDFWFTMAGEEGHFGSKCFLFFFPIYPKAGEKNWLVNVSSLFIEDWMNYGVLNWVKFKENICVILFFVEMCWWKIWKPLFQELQLQYKFKNFTFSLTLKAVLETQHKNIFSYWWFLKSSYFTKCGSGSHMLWFLGGKIPA